MIGRQVGAALFAVVAVVFIGALMLVDRAQSAIASLPDGIGGIVVQFAAFGIGIILVTALVFWLVLGRVGRRRRP